MGVPLSAEVASPPWVEVTAGDPQPASTAKMPRIFLRSQLSNFFERIVALIIYNEPPLVKLFVKIFSNRSAGLTDGGSRFPHCKIIFDRAFVRSL